MGTVHKPYIHSDRRKHGNHHGKIVPKGIVLHDTESYDADGNKDIVGVQMYLERTADKLGAHFVVDKTGRVGQSGNTTDKMYHAVGANSTHIGIEQIGFASFSLKTWYLRRRQLKKVAKLIAWISVKHGIPIVRSTGHGISLHSDWEAGGHHDPGKNYPVGRVLKWAEAYKKNGW